MPTKTNPSPSTGPRVAIVHDWLIGGGAEKVVLELHRMFPDAPIYTSYSTDEWRKKLDGKVITGYLQHLRMFRKFLPLLQYRWFRSLKLDGFDVIISSAGNGMAKAIQKPSGATHVCYCHTPVHYLWRHYERYLKRPGFGPFNFLARHGLKILVSPLRRLDYKTAQNVDQFIANSTHIKADIKRFYNRDAVVIFPPIDTTRFSSAHGSTKRQGFVTAGRLVPMKHTNIIVEACNTLKAPLTVIGGGPELPRLKALAGPTIAILGHVSDTVLLDTFSKSEAFIFASFDDFGVAPVEAMAAGLPVIALKAGGALDYVIPGKTGEFFIEQTVESLQAALETFDPSYYANNEIAAHAQQFSSEHFRHSIKNFIISNP